MPEIQSLPMEAMVIPVPFWSPSQRNQVSFFFFDRSFYERLDRFKPFCTYFTRSFDRNCHFDFSGYSGGAAISKEIQRGITMLRRSGRFVVAYLDDIRPTTLATRSAAASKIMARPTLWGFLFKELYSIAHTIKDFSRLGRWIYEFVRL